MLEDVGEKVAVKGLERALAPDGRLVRASADWLAFTGRTAEQELGFGWLESCLEPERSAWREAFATAGDAPFFQELRLRRAGGEVATLLDAVVPMRDAGGAVTGFVAAARDLTPTRAAEKELRESEARYRGLAEKSGVGIWQVTLEGHTVYANPAMVALLELESAADLDGRTYHEFFTAEALEAMDREDARRRRLEVSTYEVEIVGRKGRRVPVVLSGAPVVEGGALCGKIGTFVDVTERQRAQTELARQTQVLESVLNSMGDGVVVVDEVGKFLIWNAAATRLARVGLLESRPADWSRDYGIFLPDRTTPYPPDELPLARAMRGETTDDVELYLRNPNIPEGVTLSLSGRPLRDAEGHTKGGLVVFRDVTERKRLEEELRQSQKMEAVGRLAGGIAHDFNNLLTAIAGYADLVLAELTSDHPAHRDVVEIMNAGIRAAALTRQLLTFSRKQVEAPRVVDLSAIVARMETMLVRLIGEDVQLVTRLASAPLRVRADPNQLEQVILNLAVNSRDAMPDGGRLVIETQREVVEGASFATLVVTDTGLGMDRETCARIFEPFFTTKGPGKGTGLGLSTVYGIVRQSGGTIRVASEPGRGAAFRIQLPLVEGPVPPGSDSWPLPETPRGRETILVVEDEAFVRQLAARILRQNGHSVLAAANGSDALELARKHGGPIDLLVTDIVMPGFNGRELARRLTALQPGLKVLFISGYPGDDVAGETLGPLLAKPFAAEAFRRKVREVLDGV